MKRIAIGADHGGFDLKAELIEALRGAGHQIEDVGTRSREPVDYPVFARAVAEAVASGGADVGIVVDGAGIGSAMVANKVPGVRAALAYDLSSARNSREHNDANVLTLGAGLIGSGLARQIVDLWLATECTEPRHRRRVAMFADTAGSRSADSTGGEGGAEPTGSWGDLGPLSEGDIERVVERLHQMIGPVESIGSATPRGPCIGSCPDTARHFIRLGATGLTSVAEVDPPGHIPEDLARFIDHTLLKPDATEGQIRQLCAEALEYNFRSVCVNPTWVSLASQLLRRSEVLTCTVAGFPLGANEPETKALEARRAIRCGAREVDMVLNIGALKSGDDALVLRDIRAVVESCRDGSAVCKVMKRRACELARQARANFVKTSTGFSTGGATVEDVALMAEVVRPAGMEVKASGGIKSYTDAKALIAAGATRLGASASIGIVQEAVAGTVSA
jgi:deoxyribose-phosphate aldolase